MITYQIAPGTTDVSVVIRIIDSTDGTPETGVVFNTSGIDIQYRREAAASTAITEATLAALTTAHADGGFLHIGNGYYRLDLPDAACATGVSGVLVHGTVTGMVVIGCYIQLEAAVNKVYSDTTIIYSDTTIATSKTTQIYSDTAIASSKVVQIYSDTTIVYSDTTIATSKAVQIYSDTTIIASDTAVIEAAGGALTAAQDSKLTRVNSKSTQVYSDTTIIVSKTTIIQSDTTAIEAGGGSLTAAQDSKLTRVNSKATQIYSDTTIVYSDTTIATSKTTQIYSDTAIASSKAVQIYSDTAIIYSDTTIATSKTTQIYSDTAISSSKAVQVYSDTTAVHTQTTAIASDTVILTGPHDSTAGAFPGEGIIDQGTAQSATATTLVLRAATPFGSDDACNGATLLVLGSTQGYWQARTITDYTTIDDTATVDTWDVTPSGTITYKVFGTAPNTAAQDSKLTRVNSKATQIYSDTTITSSKAVQVYSDTTIAVSKTTQIQSDAVRIESKAVQIYSDTTIVVSDTTAIHTQTTTASSKVVQIYSDTTIAVSKSTQIYSDTTVATGAIAELSGDPGATPTPQQAVMLQYMALRNKRDTTATVDEIHNDAGTVILDADVSDDATTFSKSKYAIP